MAKRGMARPDWTDEQPKSQVSPVPEIQGKAKHSKERVRPIIAGTDGSDTKVYHMSPHKERAISDSYGIYDNDLARDNLESDFDTTAADMQDV